MPIMMLGNPAEIGVTKREFQAQWDALSGLLGGPGFADVDLIYVLNGVQSECIVQVRERDLYLVDNTPAHNSLVNYALLQGEDLEITTQTIEAAVRTMQTEHDPLAKMKKAAILAFVISEAARFMPLRDLMIRLLEGRINNGMISWRSLLGLLQNWGEIYHKAFPQNTAANAIPLRKIDHLAHAGGNLGLALTDAWRYLESFYK